ncbi:unnamed protein product [Gordionus sp. m RMFG-2023]|uniref:snRNA-activating protein complex subunit 3-like n=1 Tax=Gordionus sp. m RMFG-2023 TaxID=3053472 RepID=UPI0030E372DA
MDNLNSQTFDYTNLPKIRIKDFIKDMKIAKEKLPLDINELVDNTSLERALNIPFKIFKEIHKKCGPHVFKNSKDNINERKIDDTYNLTILEFQKKEIEKKKLNGFKSKTSARNPPTKDFELIEYLKELKYPAQQKIRHPEAILTITFYPPNQIYSQSHIYPCQIATHVDQKFDVIGLNLLTSLKDKIYCNSDYGLCEDISEDPEKPASYFTKDIFKSGFFLIENTFYNDMRQNSNVDYSEIIIKWTSDPSIKSGPYLSQTMESTKFDDLEIVLGKPYMYLHQGDCQHLFIFSDLRLINRFDPHNELLYPIRTFIVSEKLKYCYVCGLNPTKYITFNDPHVPDEPSLFCKECYMCLHYNNERKKVGNFKAYHYKDRNTTLNTRRFSTFLK